MASAPQTIREQIINQIRRDLISGEFPAGSTLRETDLANQMGVSRGPIQDAFIQLGNEGFLSCQSGEGVVVRHPPDAADRVFVVNLRTQIERYLVEKGLASVSNTAMQRVKSALVDLKTACDQCDADEVARCDIAFHESILIACGGEDVVGAWRLLCSRMLMAYTSHDSYEGLFQEHQWIYQALKKRDERASVAAIEANINRHQSGPVSGSGRTA